MATAATLATVATAGSSKGAPGPKAQAKHFRGMMVINIGYYNCNNYNCLLTLKFFVLMVIMMMIIIM